MKIKVLLFIMICLVVISCKPAPPPPPPEPEVPPELTKEEYYGQLRTMMGPLLQSGIVAPDDSTIPGLINQLQGKKMTLMLTENGRGALEMITRDIEESIRVARQEERWRKLSILCRVFKVFQPDNNKYTKTQEYADLMVKRPVLTITGFMELDNELYVFVDAFDPTLGTVFRYKVREGDEFHKPDYFRTNMLRLVKIIGNQQSVEVEYLPLNYSWICIGPKKRDVLGPNERKS